MPLYQLTDQGVSALKAEHLLKEKNLQNLAENHLPQLLDVHFLESEYTTTTGGRIDTLGVDKNGSPVIIEYKKGQNDNVINQALSYRKWLIGQKREFFEMLIVKKLPGELTKEIEVNWKEPRIICIAEKFNRFDIDTADVLSAVFKIELLTYRGYENGIFSLEPLRVINEKPSGNGFVNTKVSFSEAGEIEDLLEFHRSRGSDAIQKLFDELRSRILPVGPDIVERAVKGYIGYRASKNFAEVHIQKSSIRIYLRGIVDDPLNRVTKVPDSHGFALNQHVSFNDLSDLDYVMGLVEQSYNDVA